MFYITEIEKQVEVASFSHLSHVIREAWYLFDSSVWIGLLKYFIDGEPIQVEEQENFKSFVRHFSTHNFNIHSLSLLEAARVNDLSLLRLPLNREVGIKLQLTLILLECIDLEKSTFIKGSDWVLSKERIDRLLKNYPIYKAGSIEELSEKLFDTYNKGLHLGVVNQINVYGETGIRPYLTAAWEANQIQRTNYEKLKYFYDKVGSLKYLPLLADYCTKAIMLPNEPLLKGFFKKIKSEINHSVFDIALCDMAQMSNFIEPFPDLKPYVSFVTLDKNQYYYTLLKGSFIINVPGLYCRMHYPDLSLLKKDKKCLSLAKGFFKANDLGNVKELILEGMAKEISKTGWNDKSIQFFNQLQGMDLSKSIIYQNQMI